MNNVQYMGGDRVEQMLNTTFIQCTIVNKAEPLCAWHGYHWIVLTAITLSGHTVAQGLVNKGLNFLSEGFLTVCKNKGGRFNMSLKGKLHQETMFLHS